MPNDDSVIERLIQALSRSLMAETNARISQEAGVLNQRITDMMVMVENRLAVLENKVNQLTPSNLSQPYDVHVLVTSQYSSGNPGDNFCNLLTAVSSTFFNAGETVSTMRFHLSPVDSTITVIQESSSNLSISGPNFIDANVSGYGRLNLCLIVNTVTNRSVIIQLDTVTVDPNHTQIGIGGRIINFYYDPPVVDVNA